MWLYRRCRALQGMDELWNGKYREYNITLQETEGLCRRTGQGQERGRGLISHQGQCEPAACSLMVPLCTPKVQFIPADPPQHAGQLLLQHQLPEGQRGSASLSLLPPPAAPLARTHLKMRKLEMPNMTKVSPVPNATMANVESGAAMVQGSG